MSILVDENTKVICQGMTGKQGMFHTHQALLAGTKMVAGVTPGKGGKSVAFDVHGTEILLPVYDSAKEAINATGADVSIIYVPARFAVKAMLEAAESGMRLVICITEGIPVHDMLIVKKRMNELGVLLVGPNCPGIITPGAKCKIGIMPFDIFRPGRIGIVSRSGTLTYEAVQQVTAGGMGQSTCVGIGGDLIGGLDFVDCLKLFFQDPQTDAVVMVGEIGGIAEIEAAEYIKSCKHRKPVVCMISGSTAPTGKRMGHAGAIVFGEQESAQAKMEVLGNAGVHIAQTTGHIGSVLFANI